MRKLKVQYYFKLIIIGMTVLAIYSCAEDEAIPENPSCFYANEVVKICNVQLVTETNEASNLTRLRAIGNQIMDDQCNCHQLKGVVIIDPYFIKKIC